MPIYEGFATVGASIFIAVLAYPNNEAKRNLFVKAVAAFQIKHSAPPRSAERKELRNDPKVSWAFSIPDKRIQQIISAASRIIARRNRAAWVLLQKLASDSDPNKQSPLQDIILRAAKQNSKSYPAFYSEKPDQADRDEIIADSFRRQVLAEARPVIHLALAFYLRFEEGRRKEMSLLDPIIHADTWLKETMIAAEMLRVLFGDLFPKHDTQYKGGRRIQNYAAPPNETISILPWIDPVQPHMDFKWFLRESSDLSIDIPSCKI